MKIDIAELPNIMRTLQQLTDSQRLVAAATSVDSDVRFDPCITADDGQSLIPFTVECDISKTELLSIFQNRVEAHMRHLVQRYQIDFTKANATIAAPPLPRVDVSNVDGPATAEVEPA